MMETLKEIFLNNYKIIMIIILEILIIGFLIFIYGSLKNSSQDANEMLDVKAMESVSSTTTDILDKFVSVDIKGYVNKPNVYLLKEGANVNDLINMAGGLKKGAITTNINLSKKLTDQMVVIIKNKTELDNDNKISSCNCDEVDISICKTASVIENKTNSSENVLININTADIVDLMKLSGLGEAKAKAIIEYRNSNGNFKTIEDIKNVSGIGEALFDKIKESITI